MGIMKQFTPRMFIVYRHADIEKFKNLVHKEGGVWDNSYAIKFLNVWNKHIGTQYACIYHFESDLDMEVLR